MEIAACRYTAHAKSMASASTGHAVFSCNTNLAVTEMNPSIGDGAIRSLEPTGSNDSL